MKWPHVPNMPSEVAEQLEQRLATFLDEDASSDGGSDGVAVQELILDLYEIGTSHLDPADEGARLMELILRGLEWDTEEPRYVHAQKYVNRLFDGRLSEAHAYIDKAHASRVDDAVAAGKDAMASAGAQGGRKKNLAAQTAIKAALRYYNEHNAAFESKKDAARNLERLFPPVKHSTYYRILRRV
jgi:hypothetical protein